MIGRRLFRVVAIASLTTLPWALRAQEPYVSFCEVVQNPERYHGRSITTSGIFGSGKESSFFFDRACDSTPARDVTTLPTPYSDSVVKSDGWKRLERMLATRRQAFVVVTAVF